MTMKDNDEEDFLAVKAAADDAKVNGTIPLAEVITMLEESFSQNKLEYFYLAECERDEATGLNRTDEERFAAAKLRMEAS